MILGTKIYLTFQNDSLSDWMSTSRWTLLRNLTGQSFSRMATSWLQKLNSPDLDWLLQFHLSVPVKNEWVCPDCFKKMNRFKHVLCKLDARFFALNLISWCCCMYIAYETFECPISRFFNGSNDKILLMVYKFFVRNKNETSNPRASLTSGAAVVVVVVDEVNTMAVGSKVERSPSALISGM